MFHQQFNRLRGRKSVDTFPTHYRANTKRDVVRLAQGAGLEISRIERIEGRPEYLRITAPTNVAGFVYERIVNATRLLEPLRVLLICELARPK